MCARAPAFAEIYRLLAKKTIAGGDAPAGGGVGPGDAIVVTSEPAPKAGGGGGCCGGK